MSADNAHTGGTWWQVELQHHCSTLEAVATIFLFVLEKVTRLIVELLLTYIIINIDFERRRGDDQRGYDVQRFNNLENRAMNPCLDYTSNPTANPD